MITGSPGKDSEGVTRGLYAASIPMFGFETEKPGIRKSASEFWSRVSFKLTSDKIQRREISVRMTGVLGRRCIRVVTELACQFLYCLSCAICRKTYYGDLQLSNVCSAATRSAVRPSFVCRVHSVSHLPPTKR